jgi:serine protease Do
MKFKKTKREKWKMIVRIIVLSIILGGVSGIFTAALTTDYLADYAIELADYAQPLRHSEERLRSFPESYQEAVVRTKEDALPGVVAFFEKSARTKEGVYLPETSISLGSVLTSDGWLVSTSDFSKTFSQYSAVIQGEVYEVEQIVKDEMAGVSFVKVYANNLPVISFGSGWNAGVGDQVFVLADQNSLVPASVTRIQRGESAVLSSDEPSRYVQMNVRASSSLDGAPVTNLSGELIGLSATLESVASEYVMMISIDSVLPLFTSLLETNSIERATLGVDVIDLTTVFGAEDEMVRGYEYGAYVYAVDGKSAAVQADIEVGDIILSVDGMMIDATRALDEYLSTYKIGDEIVLTIDRDGVREDVRVTLE